MNLDAAMDYLAFVDERHRIWERRQAGDPGPWTDDPILRTRKFTNVFRVLDYGSQYLLTLLHGSERDVLMRAFLYRHTGRVETWEYLELMMGLPTVADLDDVLKLWHEYRGKVKVHVNRERREGDTGRGLGFQKQIGERPLFTGAYLVFPQSAVRGTDKMESIIRLTQRLFDPSSTGDVVPDFLRAKTQDERFGVLRRNKGVADFMSMQILTDWGYSDHCGEDREDEFVVLGPGAKRGAALVGEGIDWAVNAVRSSPRCPRLNGRAPSQMDIQNTLCEFSKYHRYQALPAQPDRSYAAVHPGPNHFVLPKHY